MSIIIHTFLNSVAGVTAGALIGMLVLFMIGIYSEIVNPGESVEETIAKYNINAIFCSCIFAGLIIFVGRGIL